MATTTTPPPRPTVGILPAMSGAPGCWRGITTARVTVILRAATPAALRHMARELEQQAKQMEMDA
jgi:hypothetical protein